MHVTCVHAAVVVIPKSLPSRFSLSTIEFLKLESNDRIYLIFSNRYACMSFWDPSMSDHFLLLALAIFSSGVQPCSARIHTHTTVYPHAIESHGSSSQLSACAIAFKIKRRQDACCLHVHWLGYDPVLVRREPRVRRSAFFSPSLYTLTVLAQRTTPHASIASVLFSAPGMRRGLKTNSSPCLRCSRWSVSTVYTLVIT